MDTRLVIRAVVILLLIAVAACLWLQAMKQRALISTLSEIEYEDDKFLEDTSNRVSRYAPDAVFEKNVRHAFPSETNMTAHLNYPIKGGAKHISQFELSPELKQRGDIISYLATGQYLNDLVESEKGINHTTSFDQLKKLPNRITLQQSINELIAENHRLPQAFCLLYLDIDDFKELNNLLGYTLGDYLLHQVANRLKSVLGSQAILARLGGDDFAVLLTNNNSQSAVIKAAKKITLILSNPFDIEGKQVFVTISMGAVFFPDNSLDADQLLIFAGTAMYQAKKLGGNNLQFYDSEFTQSSIARAELKSALSKCLKNQELELHYQPQVSLSDHHVIGAEALLRWRHPTMGLVPPDKFIPLAEDTGMIVEIGNWVLLHAFQAAVTWNKDRPTALIVAINLSPRQFIRNDLVATVKRLLKKTLCKPEWIKFEITESLLIDKNGQIESMLRNFSEIGVGLSIDDFGTGYSALSYLTSYPISQIKIDRSFISDIPVDIEKSELVKIIIQIAKVLHLDLVAEGVETIEQVEYLQNAGCYVAQGYFYYKPIPYSDFSRLVNFGNPVFSLLRDQKTQKASAWN